MKLLWTRLALKDLESAYDYIVDQSPSAAAHVIERIEKAVSALSRHPDIGRPGRVQGTRELIIPGPPFIVSYRIKDKAVEILAVIHGARRWPNSFPS